MRNWARYKKFLAAALAGAVVWVAMIPTDADSRLVAAGNIIIALSVLFAPSNARPVTRADLAREVGPTRFRGRDDTGFP
jgi:uncharacterized membrane protein